MGCRLWGRTESDMTEATEQQQQQQQQQRTETALQPRVKIAASICPLQMELADISNNVII